MKLPIIKQVAIENLSLYNEDIYYTLSPGINMVIGGNGIGKTTLVNILLPYK
jgi:ABC-type multidrug transport system ATPase subunit